MLIDIIAGARPNFMKIAPIIAAIEKRSNGISFRLIHTGQHYDKAMSGSFFEQLGIPEPNINLEVGSGTQAEQTAKIMERYEAVLLDKKSDLCLVVGDVTSTMACSITAKKLHVKVAHVEGGIRSGDMTMPEEINRIVTDSISDYFFTTSETANQNLRNSGVSDNRIFFVGNTMIDTLLKNLPRLEKPAIWNEINLQEKGYLVLTLHRPNNVDEHTHLISLISKIMECSHGKPVIFPVHPRTKKNLEKLEMTFSNLYMVSPMGYLEFIYLIKNSLVVVTDSGGITEETTVLGVPCMTLRSSTERPETVTMGTNELLGVNPEALKPAFDKLYAGNWKSGEIPELWDGNTAERIADIIEKWIKD